MKQIFLALLLSLPLMTFAGNYGIQCEEGVPVDVTYACFHYKTVIPLLSEKFHEKKVFESVNKDVDEGMEYMISLWRNAETGTWTLIETNEKADMACFLAYGKDNIS